MEQKGNMWNTLEATVSYSTWARLTPTLTHVVAYELATSGAEDDAMSLSPTKKFRDRDGAHIPYKQDAHHGVGTSLFTSINTTRNR